jgi:hypothetical protein
MCDGPAVKQLPMEQFNQIFNLLERCHTILADVFPHEGLRKVGGSQIFLREPLLGILNKCVKEIVKELRNPIIGSVQNDLGSLWSEVVELLSRIENQNLNNKSADEINNAAILLYLASGATWNLLRALAAEEPLHNQQYVRIEPLKGVKP